jgi:hypothetical protein
VAIGSAFGPVVVDRVVYGTITIMCVLIVYDGWSRLKLLDVLGVIIGPIVAMFLSHVFSSALAQQVDLGRRLTGSESVATIRAESRFLLLAVPPSLLTVVLSVAGVSLTACIQIILWAGVASLGFWGGLAGHRAGLIGWRLALFVLAGFLVGALILAIQVLLQPGKAITGGVA